MANKLDVKWISDVIGVDYLSWEKGDTVTIESPTNTGKTTFILKTLLPSLQTNDTILYICNRIELKRQIKIDLLKLYNKSIPEDITKLDNIVQIGKVFVLSYHSIGQSLVNHEYNIREQIVRDHKYIVYDEVHFFYADSQFNNQTHKIAKELILKEYPQSIKIMLSGTMEEFFPIIEHNTKGKLHRYTTGKDYSYLNTRYFSDYKDIIQMVKNDQSNDKWIIFVTSKNRGNKIRAELNKLKISCTFITSENNNLEKQNISKYGMFNCKVLITTKCLDNGISIHDDSVKHIVLSVYDRITFMQEIGRIRIDIENARTINLYLDMKNKRSFNHLLNIANLKSEIIELYEKDYNKFESIYNHNTDKVPNELFFIGKESEKKWQLNLLAKKRLMDDKQFYISMISKFKNKGKYAYIYEQLKWLGNVFQFEESNIISNVKDNDELENLKQYLDSIVGEKLFNEERKILSNLLIKELVTINTDTDYRTTTLQPSTIESLLRVQLKLPFVVSEAKKETKGTNRGKRYIVINKIN